MRRALIGCLAGFDASQLEEPSGPRSPTLLELDRVADKIIASTHVGSGRMFDLCRLKRELLNVAFAGRFTPITASLVLHRVLGPVPIADRATLALSLLNAVRDDQFANLTTSALLTLRRALTFEDAAVTGSALTRLDHVLRQRVSVSWSGSTLLVADRLTGAHVQAAKAQLAGRDSRHIVVLLTAEEEQTHRDVMLEHVRLQFRCLEDADLARVLTCGTVQLVTVKGLKPAQSFAKSVSSALATFGRALLVTLWPPLRVEADVTVK